MTEMIYLDTAATSLTKPQSVHDAVFGWARRCANPGRAGHRLSVDAARAVYAAREAVAGLFGIDDPARVIFCSNGTDALNLAIHGMLSPGDHAVCTTMEHNSVLRPLDALQAAGVAVTYVETGADGVVTAAAVARALRPDTKLVVVTHASNLTGIRNPVAEIGAVCRANGSIFLVDAAQTAGCVPIDVDAMQIDLLAAPGHKSLFGWQGTGFLYVGERACLRPLKQGGTGSRSTDTSQPLSLPDRYESGTLNLPGIVSLYAGVAFVEMVGFDAITRHADALSRQLLDGLDAIPCLTLLGSRTAARTPCAAFCIDGVAPAEVAYLLDTEYGIAVRAGMHCAPLAHRSLGSFESGAVRMSAGYFNTGDEIARALDAVAQIAAR